VFRFRFAPLLFGLVLGIALAGAAFLVARYRQPPPPPPPVVRLAFAAPPGTVLGAGDEPLDAAISPDDREIAFVATSAGVARLWRRGLESPQAQMIAGTEGARLPTWKLTGHAIAFVAGDRLKQVTLGDGAVRTLVEAPGAAGASWLPDGSLLFASANHPIRLLRSGSVSDATSLQAGDRSHAYPMATGAAGAFVYVAVRDDGRRIVRLHQGAMDRDMAETTAHAQLVGDQLLYVRQGALLAEALDAKGALAGNSRLIAADVGASGGRAFFTASPRVVLTAPAGSRARQLVWFEGDRRVGTVGDPGDYWQVRLSPDDQYAAVTYLDPLLRTLDVIVMSTSPAGTREGLTSSLAADTDPVWSPDGTRVLFRSLQNGKADLYARRAHVADAPEEVIVKSELDETPTDWTASNILFTAPMKATGLDVWEFDSAARELTGLATTGFNESDARFSPNREWVSFVSDESSRPDVYAVPYPEGDRVRISLAGGMRPRWRRDSEAIFFTRGDDLMRSDYNGSDPVPFAPAVPVTPVPGLRDFDVAHRSDRLLLLLPVDTRPEPTVSAIVDWKGIR
jgi:Tol biopolymer transport system component